jgi:hypothetical protein
MVVNLFVAMCLMSPLASISNAPAADARQQPASAGVASIAETKHEFGIVTAGTMMSHTFIVRNDSRDPVKIEGVDLQAPGMKTSFKPLIAPGETGRITIEWDSVHLDGPVVGKAIVRLSDVKLPSVELVLTATVKRSIDILPMPAVFFSIYKGDTATRSITVVNRESRPLEITSIEPAGTHFDATITPVKAGETYRLDVTVPRTAAPGRFMESVYLNTNHPTLKRLRIAVNVLVKNELYVNPEVVDLGQISLAELTAKPQLVQLLDQKLIVRKRTGDFIIKSVSSDIPAVNVRTSSEGRAQAFQIDLSIIRERLVPGRLTGIIRIETDDKEFPVLEVPVAGIVR